MEKTFIILIMTISVLSCQTAIDTPADDSYKSSVIEKVKKERGSRAFDDGDIELIVELKQYALEASDIISLLNVYQFSSLTTNKIHSEAVKDANILKTSWGVNDKEGYLKRLDRLVYEGVRGKFINILELLLTKKDVFNNYEKIIDKKTWDDDINSGLITLEDYYKVVFLISRAEYISFQDMHMFELERLSIFIRWGYALRYITKEDAGYLLEELALEMSNFDYSWSSFGSSYVSGLTMLWLNNPNIDQKIRNRSLAVIELLNNHSWSKSSWRRLRELSEELERRGLYKGKTIFYKTVKPPKAPNMVGIDPRIAILFEDDRISQSYVEDFRYDSELYNAIVKDDLNKVKQVVSNHGDKIVDSQLSTGASFIYEASILVNKTILEYLLKSGFDSNLQNTGNSVSPLYRAVINRDYESLSLLIKYDVDVNALNDSKISALGKAISLQDVKSVEMLLEAGADPLYGIFNKRNKTYWGALVNNDRQIANSVISHINNKSINPRVAYNDMLMLIEEDKREVFSNYISKSADLEYREDNGYHILYQALREKDNYWAVDILINSGFNLELPGYNNYSILSSLAAKNKFDKIIDIIDKGYDLDSYDNNQGIPIIEQMFLLINDKDSESYTNFIKELEKREIYINEK
jgi:ankyrin repeat protein